jgi:hypothetical protein
MQETRKKNFEVISVPASCMSKYCKFFCGAFELALGTAPRATSVHQVYKHASLALSQEHVNGPYQDFPD